MYEVELKVRAAHKPLRERLSALDAASLGTVRQEDTYYDAPHRAFAETDEALRLRRETTDEGTRLTYKGPLVESASKTREERETAIEDPVEMDGILDALGFSPAGEVSKDRERFECGEYTVVLDDVDELGEFVEVEQEVEEAEDIERVRDGACELLSDLGCDPDEQIRTSYLELLEKNDSNSDAR